MNKPFPLYLLLFIISVNICSLLKIILNLINMRFLKNNVFIFIKLTHILVWLLQKQMKTVCPHMLMAVWQLEDWKDLLQPLSSAFILQLINASRNCRLFVEKWSLYEPFPKSFPKALIGLLTLFPAQVSQLPRGVYVCMHVYIEKHACENLPLREVLPWRQLKYKMGQESKIFPKHFTK